MRIPHPAHGAQHSGSSGFEGDAVRRYDWMAKRLMRGPYRRIAADAVAAVPQGGSVLDVGTGPGQLLVELARLRPDLQVTGLDLSADMVAAAARNLAGFGERARAVVGDVAELPFPDASFDLIVSSLSVHHWPDPAAGVAEVVRVRREGGQIRIYDFRAAPFATVRAAAASALGCEPDRVGVPEPFRITPFPLPFHLISRLVL